MTNLDAGPSRKLSPDSTMTAPYTVQTVLRLFEASACRDYYYYSVQDATRIGASEHVPEELCKSAPTQEEVVFLSTSIAVLTSIICLTCIATGLFQMMGGGGRVVSAMILSSPDSQTKHFYYMQVADYATQLIAPSLTSLLMSFGVWAAFGLGIVAAVVALLAVLILPETAPSRLDRGSGEAGYHSS